ncbi:dehydrogenase [Allostella vacuolata]|nr:dehydrogenase [Stella vacuolata]
MTSPTLPVLRIGFIGSGFMARFHLQSLTGVRNAVVTGVFSTTAARREAFAAEADRLDLGPCRPYGSIEAMLASGEVDAVWIANPNYARLEAMEEIHRLVKAGRTPLRAVACEKPLARTLGDARRMLALVQDCGLLHGYLENQLFSTAVQRGHEIIWRRAVPNSGRPYLARAAEEHSGPHEPWFWQGEQQGGGVLSDMMCHSVEVARFLLSAPGEARGAMRLVSANATVANLKWTRPEYARKLAAAMGGVDYTRRPSEDFARGILTLEDPDGNVAMIEATTSWAYVGPGLRINLELLGPEYAMEFSSLNTGLKVFLSRGVAGAEGEDLVEKQNAEQGLMPVLDDEPGIYGYTLENRHMVERFRRGQQPMETFDDGVAVVEMLMALYRSAELGRTVTLPDENLETYVPVVARPALP